MCLANPLWGAPRIYGELLRLGIKVSQATVAKYRLGRPHSPSSTWRSFLHNHVAGAEGNAVASVRRFAVSPIGQTTPSDRARDTILPGAGRFSIQLPTRPRLGRLFSRLSAFTTNEDFR